VLSYFATYTEAILLCGV